MVIGNIPNPPGSAIEKLISERHYEQVENHIRERLSENPTQEEILDAFRYYDEEIRRYWDRYSRVLDQWANIHTHPGGAPRRLQWLWVASSGDSENPNFEVPAEGTGWFDFSEITSVTSNQSHHSVYPTAYIFKSMGVTNDNTFEFHALGTMSITFTADIESVPEYPLFMSVVLRQFGGFADYVLNSLPVHLYQEVPNGRIIGRLDLPVSFVQGYYPQINNITNPNDFTIELSIGISVHGVEVFEAEYETISPV